jgi:hypothetical protein
MDGGPVSGTRTSADGMDRGDVKSTADADADAGDIDTDDDDFDIDIDTAAGDIDKGDGDGTDQDGAGPAGGGPWLGAVRVLLTAAGLTAIGYGLHGLVIDRRATNPSNAVRWLVGGILVHDLLIVPVTAAVGLGLTVLVRAPYRAVLQGALLVSGAVTLATLPLWRGYGGPADNPTVNPLPYGRNLVIVLGLVWLAAALIIVARAVRSRRR